MTDELKPCAHCGSEAYLDFDNDHHGEWFNLGCSSEKCFLRMAFYTEEMKDLEKAISAWNTRVTDDEAQDTITKLLARELDLLCTLQKLQAKYEKAVAFIGRLEHTYDACEFHSLFEACPACEAQELLKELKA